MHINFQSCAYLQIFKVFESQYLDMYPACKFQVACKYLPTYCQIVGKFHLTHIYLEYHRSQEGISQSEWKNLKINFSGKMAESVYHNSSHQVLIEREQSNTFMLKYLVDSTQLFKFLSRYFYCLSKFLSVCLSVLRKTPKCVFSLRKGVNLQKKIMFHNLWMHL